MLMENNQLILLFVNIQSLIIDSKCCYVLKTIRLLLEVSKFSSCFIRFMK